MIGKQSAARIFTHRRFDRTSLGGREQAIPATTFDARFPTPQLTRGWPAPGPHQTAPWVDPLDSRHIVIAQHRAGEWASPARVSFDGGLSWRESGPLPMPPFWTHLVEPVLGIDAHGRLHLVARALGRAGSRACLVTYRSDDGGLDWSLPAIALQGHGECSFTLVSDLNPASAFVGRTYLVAAAGCALHLLVSDDGESWMAGGLPAPSLSFPGPYQHPQALIDSAGVVHIVWIGGALDRKILSSYSVDGGLSFERPAVVATLADQSECPETMPATCITPDGVVVCAWTNYHAGQARICLRRSTDRARTWLGPSAGEPLAPQNASHHQFQPRLLATPGGEICCAYYQYGPKTPGGDPLVDLVMSVSYDRAVTFTRSIVLNAEPWSPAGD